MRLIEVYPGDSFDTFYGIEDLFTIEEVAKASQSGIGKAKLYLLLREQGLIFGTPARPYQKCFARGLMVVIPTFSDVNGRRKKGHNQIFLTGKGFALVVKLIQEHYVKAQQPT
jgi:phage antirepressor YoqD-like protein